MIEVCYLGLGIKKVSQKHFEVLIFNMTHHGYKNWLLGTGDLCVKKMTEQIVH